MDFSLAPDLEPLAREATEVGHRAAETSPHPDDSWIVGESDAFARELADRGWIGMTWPAELGGGGRSELERFLVWEALISSGAPVASIWFADRQIGPTLLQFGSEEQVHRWLPGITAGTARWCIGMSEADAGSDVASLRTSAERDGGAWVVNGTKIWTSGAHHADWCYLVCRTDPEAPKHRGLSELIVDMRAPGITVRPITDITGARHFCEVTFEDVRVGADDLVGTVNGSFGQLMRQMEHERGGIDRLVSNRRLYEDHLVHADRADPRVRQRIAGVESGYRIGRLLVLRETVRQAPAGFSAATKTFCTEFEQRVAQFCAAIDGPRATLEGRMARSICYAPGYTIMGGTTQVLRTVIGERLLGLPREPR